MWWRGFFRKFNSWLAGFLTLFYNFLIVFLSHFVQCPLFALRSIFVLAWTVIGLLANLMATSLAVFGTQCIYKLYLYLQLCSCSYVCISAAATALSGRWLLLWQFSALSNASDKCQGMTAGHTHAQQTSTHLHMHNENHSQSQPGESGTRQDLPDKPKPQPSLNLCNMEAAQAQPFCLCDTLTEQLFI